MLSSLAEAVPHTMLSSEAAVPHTMLSSEALSRVPQTMFCPVRLFGAPHTTPTFQALAFGLMMPPCRRWLPHSSVRLHVLGTARRCPAWAVLKKRTRSTAPFEFRNPAPCVSAL